MNAQMIENWLKNRLSELLELPSEKFDVNKPLTNYGLDSSAAIGLTQELEEWLGREVDPTIVYDYPTISQLSRHLGG